MTTPKPMKLFFTATSPFVRKVLVAARERGLGGRLETVVLRPTPLQADPELSKVNPLSKIPALVREDGSTLYDSAVICEYLDSLPAADGAPERLLPAAGEARWQALRLQALCDGILEAGISAFYEGVHRPIEFQWEPWRRGQVQKIDQGLDQLEREAEGLSGTEGRTVDLAAVCAGVTLGWLEFRKPAGDVRRGRTRLFKWYDAFRGRPSMAATEPVA